MSKNLYIATADGSVWKVEKEFPKYYLVKSRFTMRVYKSSVIKTFLKEREK